MFRWLTHVHEIKFRENYQIDKTGQLFHRLFQILKIL